MKKLITLLFIPALLVGCVQEEWRSDPNKRQELFKQCMQLLPAGPVSTQYNDWDEVVTACDNIAYYQANRCVKNCKDTTK